MCGEDGAIFCRTQHAINHDVLVLSRFDIKLSVRIFGVLASFFPPDVFGQHINLNFSKYRLTFSSHYRSQYSREALFVLIFYNAQHSLTITDSAN